MTAIWAVVPAAGNGSRMRSAQPKQFLPLSGHSVLAWSVTAVLSDKRVNACMVALAQGCELPADLDQLAPSVRSCVGGATRADSVLAGLLALDAEDTDWALVHDAARPCLSRARLSALIDRVLDTDVGAILALPVADTLKRGDTQGMVTDTLDRSELWRAQTPQMFRVGELRRALQHALAEGYTVTDEASAIEFLGLPVQLVEGEPANAKVTFSDDLDFAQHWLEKRVERAEP